MKQYLKFNQLFVLILVLLASFAASAEEGVLNQLLAPGPLVKGHKELGKSDCLKCHETGQGTPDSKCLDCHKAIRPFVDRKTGFHGLTSKSCRDCHAEHKGIDHFTMGVDEANFDHKGLTGYSLDGKHQDLKCSECHTAKLPSTFVKAGHIRYFGNQTTCVACHKKDDIHFFKPPWSKKDCSTCHSPESWTAGLKFDHARDAKYRLEGKHGSLKCVDCHGPSKQKKATVYKWPKLKSNQCLTCHEDQHKRNFSPRFSGGSKCLTCHTQEAWKIASFDHRLTNYPLKGKHAEIKCIECHKQSDPKLQTSHKNFKFKGLQTTCLTCHKDYHRFGKLVTKHFGVANKCQSCHVESDWKTIVRFEHDKYTRYPITGEHLKLNCMDCHFVKGKNKKVLKVSYRWPLLESKTCENCHQSPHRNEFSAELLRKKCSECHVTSGWYDTKTGKSFDHSRTKFPLTGAHKSVTCAECHGPQGKQVFKFKSADKKFCIDCHSNIHTNQFSAKMKAENCTQCHTTENFKTRLTFNHDSTNYSLEGAHKDLKCAACHVPTEKRITLQPPNIAKASAEKERLLITSKFQFHKFAKEDCLTCHVDHHKSQLGTKCLDCHNIQSWKKPRFDHDKQSDFALLGKHQEVKCQECHKPIPGQFIKQGTKNLPVIRYKPISGQCLTCHKDVHQGAFGTNCKECHTERGWKFTKDFHKNFTLTGVHYSLQCAECHRDNRKLSGLSQQCLTCHAKDDVHRGTLHDCQECHRQQFWEVATFKHSLTQFPLRGVHRTLDCMECHRTGSYKGLGSDCASCHLQEALAVTTPNHSSFGNLNSCNSCHLNQFSWK